MALREIWQKAKQGGPAAALLAASGALGLLAAASSYRLSLRLLEKRLPPATAALVATGCYLAAAAGTGVLGARRMREVPLPVPTETVKDASAAMADAAAERDATAPASGGLPPAH